MSSRELTSNAMIAKVQGLFAKRLNSRHYKELVGKRSIPEIASYLKKETYFSAVLEGINEQAIHRGQLEFLIRQNTYDKMKRLLRYVDSDKNEYYQLVVFYYEVSLILFKIRILGREKNINLEMNYMNIDKKHASFSYASLYAIEDIEALSELLKPTRYFPILELIKTRTESDINFTEIEQELNQIIFRYIMNKIDEDYSGRKKLKIKEMLKTRLEIINVGRLYRLKKYFQLTEDEIRGLLMVEPVNIPAEIWEKWICEIDSSKADSIYEMLKSTKYHRFMKDEPFNYIEYHIQGILYRIAQKEIRAGKISEVVYYQFMNFLNVEVENIVCVIEGVRYNYEPSKIEARIVQ